MNVIDPICLDDDGELLSSSALIPVVRDLTGGRVLLAVSGRDSLSAWLLLRDAGFEIIPYFCYTIPHLSYDDEMLDYYERFFGTHIKRFPHPRTYTLLNAAAFQTPSSWNLVSHCQLPSFEFADLERRLAAQYAMPEDNFLCAVGIRAADNLMRHRLIHQQGTIGRKRRHFYYAVWDYKTRDVRDALERAGCKLSKSYLYFGSTGDGIEYKFIRYLKDNLPDDYRRVCELFPLVDAELFRYEAVK